MVTKAILRTAGLVDELAEMPTEVLVIGGEYVVGVPVRYERPYDRIVDLDNNSRTTAACVL